MMVRPTTKRKSESALPTGKSKQRKTSASRGDVSDSQEAGEESSDQFLVAEGAVAPKYVKKSNPKSRKSEPVRSTRVDEYEEDEGRMETKHFLALVEFETKKKKRAAKAATEYIDKVENNLARAEESLKKRLQDLSIVSTEQDSHFIDAFKAAYACSRPLPPPKNVITQGKTSAEDISFATLFERSKSLTANALMIIEKFESANEKTSKLEMASLMDNNWGEENETAANVLMIGARVGLDKYHAWMAGTAAPELEHEDVVFADAIYGCEREDVVMPWGKIARKYEKYTRKFVKVLNVE